MVKLHTLASALDGGEWSASYSNYLFAREKDPKIHCMGLRVSIVMAEKRNPAMPGIKTCLSSPQLFT